MRLILVVTFCLLNLISAAPAYSLNSGVAETAQADSYWTVLGGYGATYVGLGKTSEHVETADLVLRYGLVLRSDVGRSWFRGHHDLLIELPVYLVLRPVVSPMFGMNFLASYFFTTYRQGSPYVFAGGGPVYIESSSITNEGLNGNYQAGIGFLFKTKKGHKLNAEYRFHHISNAGTRDPNVPLNSSKFLLGITFF